MPSTGQGSESQAAVQHNESGEAVASVAQGSSTVPAPSPSTVIWTPQAQTAWKTRCDSLPDEEKQHFIAVTADGLDDYIHKLRAACQEHRDKKVMNKMLDKMEPLYNLIGLLMPAMKTAAQASSFGPNPASLVLGGIIGVVQLSRRLLDYQKLVLSKLAKMSIKATILRKYEEDINIQDEAVQRTLVKVYGHIIEFCHEAVRPIKTANKNTPFETKIRHLKSTIFHDFESRFDDIITKFQNEVELFDGLLAVAKERRLNQAIDKLRNQNDDIRKMVSQNEIAVQQQNTILSQLHELHKLRDEKKKVTEEARLRKDCLRWFSTVHFTRLFEERCNDHIEGTGEWLKNSTQYREWKNSDTSELLWITGKPGCGKSMLAAAAIIDLRLEMVSETAVAYALLRRDRQETETWQNILAALVKHLVIQSDAVMQELHGHYNDDDEGAGPLISTTRSVLKSVASRFKTVFLVVDAIDECQQGDRLLDELLMFFNGFSKVAVKLLVLSRPHGQIDAILDAYTPLRPDHGHNTKDLEIYIESKFPDDSQEEFRKICLEKAEGMFLWVRLVYDSFKSPSLDNTELERLKRIPPGLDSIYAIIFEQLWSEDEDTRSTALFVLLWITHAFEPLKARQVSIAVTDMSKGRTLKAMRSTSAPQKLVKICQNLVYIDQDGYLRFIHGSVRRYLLESNSSTLSALSAPIKEFQRLARTAHQHLARVCMNYLSLEELNETVPYSNHDMRVLDRKHPFMMYAARYWGTHASEGYSAELGPDILTFLRSGLSIELTLAVLACDHNLDLQSNGSVQKSCALHVLSAFGLDHVAEMLPSDEQTSNHDDRFGNTALQHALTYRRGNITAWLIDHQQSLPPELLCAAMYIAAAECWLNVITRTHALDNSLLNKPFGRDGSLPLIVACDHHNKDAIEKLIELGADIHAKDFSDTRAIIAAADNELPEIVRLLLTKGADVNVCDNNGHTPLSLAMSKNNVEIMRILKDYGADPMIHERLNAVPPVYQAAAFDAGAALGIFRELFPDINMHDMKHKSFTPLQAAAFLDARQATAALVRLGIPLNDIDEANRSALHLAVESAHPDIVEILVKGDCDVLLQDRDGDTALHLAARMADLKIVRIIITNSQRSWAQLASTCNHHNETALHQAIVGGNAEILSLLLQIGCDFASLGLLKSSPLHYAARYGRSDMCYLLLSLTRDPNPRNQHGETPLHFAARAGSLAFIKKLEIDCKELDISLDIGALSQARKTAFYVAVDQDDEETANHLARMTPEHTLAEVTADGNSILNVAAWYGRVSLFDKLLAHCSTTQRGFKGRTALICAAMRGHYSAVQRLTLAGQACALDVPDDDSGNTPLVWAMTSKHLDIANHLLDQGADFKARDSYGNTLLHLAVYCDNLDIFKRLLELGCQSNEVNFLKQTVFHFCVMHDRLDVLEFLVQQNLGDGLACDSEGRYCDIFAAEIGSLSMLRRLRNLGVSFGNETIEGYNAAHLACSGGHVDVLKFLDELDINIHHSSLVGVTPLMCAAETGHLLTVKYYIAQGNTNLDQCSNISKQTALLSAAYTYRHRTMAILAQAGCDTSHRDFCGMSSDDISKLRISNPWHPEENHGGFLYTVEHRQAQLHTVVMLARCLMDDNPNTQSDLTHSQRDIYQGHLSDALRCMQDYNMAKICDMERIWRPLKPGRSPMVRCDICGREWIPETLYTCEVCYPMTNLCEACHEAYNDAGKQVPEAWTNLAFLEDKVQDMRLAARDLNLLDIFLASHYYVAMAAWVVATAQEYALWQQKHAPTKKYPWLKPAGLTWIQMILDMKDISTQTEHMNEDQKLQLMELVKKFERHERNCRADKEITVLPCKGHTYYCSTDDEYAQLQCSDGPLDPDLRVLKPSFYKNILEKYAGYQSHTMEHKPLSPDIDVRSQPSPQPPPQPPLAWSPDEVCKSEIATIRPRLSVRQQTQPKLAKSIWQSPMSTSESLLPEVGPTEGQRHEDDGAGLQAIKKSSTFPVSASESLSVQTTSLSTTPREETTTETERSVFSSDGGNLLDEMQFLQVLNVVAASNKGELSSEPELPTQHAVELTKDIVTASDVSSAAESGQVHTTNPRHDGQSQDSSQATATATDPQRSAIDDRLKAMFTIVQAKHTETDPFKAKYWPLALKLADAIYPGFKNRCIEQAYLELIAE